MKRYHNNLTMTKRCLLLSVRNPDIILTSILLPALLMLLFVSLFGGLIHLDGISYVNYIVPGVLLQCIGQGSSSTAISMNKDIGSGILNRFCTLPIKKNSILTGHIWEAIFRNLITTVIVLMVAVLLGFRPSAGLSGWLIVFLLLLGIILALSWLSVFIGMKANSAEGASSLSAIIVVLPYLSSGFVPTEQMPKVLSIFAEYQPMTPIIDSMRSAFLGYPFDPSNFLAAILWCAGLSFLFYFLSMHTFKTGVNK